MAQIYHSFHSDKENVSIHTQRWYNVVRGKYLLFNGNNKSSILVKNEYILDKSLC